MQFYPTARRGAGQTIRLPVSKPDEGGARIIYPTPANDNRVIGKPANDNKKRPLSPRRFRRNLVGDTLGVTQTILDGLEAINDLNFGTGAPALNMAGWNPAGVCRGGPEDVIGTWLSCARPFSPGLIAPGATIPGSTTQIMTMWRDNAIAGRPYLPIRIYTRAAQAQPQPNPWTVPKVGIVPEPWPLLDPAFLPIHSPFAQPFARHNYAWRAVHRFMGVQIRGNHLPGVRPLPRPRPRPPGPGVKETKVALAIGGQAANIVHYVTEGIDVVQAIWWAFPSWFTKMHRNATFTERLMLMYENWNLVDGPTALFNILNEQGKDRFFGQLGRLTAKANRRRGMPGGLTLGPAL